MKEMALSLSILMVVVWLMVLAVAAFLVAFVAPFDTLFPSPRIETSAIQAVIAVLAVVALVFGLGMLKKLYLQRKLT